MDFILTIAFLGIIVALGTLIYKYFSGNQMVATDDMYKQRDVTVEYKPCTIKIKNHTYDVKKVTGVSKITQTNGRRNTYYIQIEVDDMAKPVHKIPVIGSGHNADEFLQRICVAIRKAGGTSFI